MRYSFVTDNYGDVVPLVHDWSNRTHHVVTDPGVLVFLAAYLNGKSTTVPTVHSTPSW